MKIKNNLCKIFLVAFSILFAILILGTIFDNKSIITIINPFYVIISLVVEGIIALFVYKKLDKNMSKKKEIIIGLILFLILLIKQMAVAKYLISYPRWDWNNVFSSAKLFALGRKGEVEWSYFQMFPNNNGLFYLEIILFKILKVLNLLNDYSIQASIILNIICIDISVIFLYFTARNIFSKKEALMSLVFCIMSTAFSIYVPILYTDTITMMFPIFILFCYAFWKKNKEKKSAKYIFIPMTFFTYFGLKLKYTIVIMLVAIVIDMILNNKFKEYIKALGVFATSFVIFFFAFNFLETKFTVMPYDIKNNNKEIPYTHWVMMGMTERPSYREHRNFIGWYNPNSYDYTLKYKTKATRKKANIKMIQKQFKDYGFIDYTTFLYRKMLFTWSDGTFYAPAFLAESPVKTENNLIKKFYSMGNEYNEFTCTTSTGFIVLLYILIILGAIKNIKCDKKAIETFLGLFGVMLFFVIWESSSRYLINYVPIMIIAALYGLTCLDKKKKIKDEKKQTVEKNCEIKKEVIKMKNSPVLYLVIPCYNEEEVLEETTRQLKAKMKSLIKEKKISNKSKVMYVNDGSKDKTWELIKKINSKESLFTGITLSRNRGHQNALLGGLMTARKYADVVISMDADLQDDINAMDGMIDKYNNEGCDIVYGVRSARKTDTWFKRTTAEGFYKFMKVLGVDVVYNHADYRLTSKRVLDEFSNFKEVNLFLRGMFPLVGYKSDVVYYERNERFAGESKYPLKKMLNFAWDGITSFSVKPLRFICTTGFLILFISVCIMIYSLIRKLTGNTVDGWTFLSISIWFIGGLQMISVGIIGEYVGKMYSETKARPRYIISENLEENK